jgi:hypothetical protein
MAYKINRSTEHIVLPDGPTTLKDVKRYISQRGTPEFYELEPAEVLSVLLDEDDLPFIGNTDDKDWSRYGWARVRMAISSVTVGDTILVAPLDSNIKEYPYPNEYVIVASYFGKKYYTQKLNLLNSSNANSFPGLSAAYNPQKDEWIKTNLPPIIDPTIRQIKAEEGDIIFNGRFGQSIKFGSNIKEIIKDDNTSDVNTGKQNSPNLIIRAGQGEIPEVDNKPVKEDINLDGSSIWMTTDQIVDINTSNNNQNFLYTQAEKGSDGFGGNQIIINSDRLIFNTKKNAIIMTSPTAIGLSANYEIGLEVPNDTGKVMLGDAMDQTQPALGGKLTMELIDKLLDYLITFANDISSAKGTCVNFTIPISDIYPGSKGLVASLKELKTRMDEPKSKTVFVGHIRG